MDFKWIFVTFASLYLQLISCCGGQLYVPTFGLGDKDCDTTVTIPCPLSEASVAGSFTIKHLRQNCVIILKLADECDPLTATQTFAFYFLFRRFNLPDASGLRIWQVVDTPGPGGIIFRLGGAQRAVGNPENVAQVLTDFTLRPTVSFEYFSESDSIQSPDIHIDYVVVEELGSAQKSYCFALSGYMDTNLVCNSDDFRINCPSRYTRAYGANPSYGRQYCQAPTTIKKL